MLFLKKKKVRIVHMEFFKTLKKFFFIQKLGNNINVQ